MRTRATLVNDISKLMKDTADARQRVEANDESGSSARADILAKPIFRAWLRHNNPAVYEYQEDTEWRSISVKLAAKFGRYETHLLRVRYNLGRIQDMPAGDERDDLERRTLESAS